jgi:hypothetical protein
VTGFADKAPRRSLPTSIASTAATACETFQDRGFRRTARPPPRYQRARREETPPPVPSASNWPSGQAAAAVARSLRHARLPPTTRPPSHRGWESSARAGRVERPGAAPRPARPQTRRDTDRPRPAATAVADRLGVGVGVIARRGVRIIVGKQRRHRTMPTRLQLSDRPPPTPRVNAGSGERTNVMRSTFMHRP